uniref:Reverse transcriptase domain-containing protein n=1 Tax=Tanacetum cinerariifolium TaxID=118510 RepID=A0A6L2MLN5_TANCI|nr:hypothetical protein [Tanacetum cinerariifolium]
MYEYCIRNLGVNIQSRLGRCKLSMIDFSGETYHPLGVIDLRVTLEKEGRSKTVLMEFAIIKCRSPYNIIIGRTEMRSLEAVGSTIHSMIKFPTNQGVITMETNREALQECKHLERVQGLWKEVQWRQHKEQMSRIREQNAKEAFTISHEHSDQYVMTKTTLTTNCKQLLADVLRENKEVFAWTGSKRTTVPRFVMEHQLKIYPLARPIVHKRQAMASKRRLALKEKVFHWLKEGLIRKDMYPLPEKGKRLASLMGYWYKYLLRLPKEYNQIRMAKGDEEKTRFHTEEKVYCFTHMPKELKNSAATLQRMMENVLVDQRGQNVETYLEEIVIKSKSELGLVQDVKETFRKLKRVNIKINPTMSLFKVKERRFLGHMLVELKHPIREARTRMEKAKEFGWTNEAEEALRRIKGN